VCAVVGSNQAVAKSGGRRAKPAEEVAALGARVLRLRSRLAERRGVEKVTQDEIAARGGFTRNDLSFFEGGKKLSSYDAYKKLTSGYGITMDALDAYLAGKIDVDTALDSTEHPRGLSALESVLAANWEWPQPFDVSAADKAEAEARAEARGPGAERSASTWRQRLVELYAHFARDPTGDRIRSALSDAKARGALTPQPMTADLSGRLRHKLK
jgi:transcriptional regulator with XRE-family HTH domain